MSWRGPPGPRQGPSLPCRGFGRSRARCVPRRFPAYETLFPSRNLYAGSSSYQPRPGKRAVSVPSRGHRSSRRSFVEEPGRRNSRCGPRRENPFPRDSGSRLVTAELRPAAAAPHTEPTPCAGPGTWAGRRRAGLSGCPLGNNTVTIQATWPGWVRGLLCPFF